jgi:hypothetical protein
VTIRSTQDYILEVSTTSQSKVLLEHLISKGADFTDKKVQFFFSGKEIDLEKMIGSYMTENGVVTVFIRSLAK